MMRQTFPAFIPVIIDILDLIDLLLDALTGHAVGLKLVHLLVNEIGGGLVEILEEVLDHLRDDVVGLLLILPLVGQVRLRVPCNGNGRRPTINIDRQATTKVVESCL